MIGNTADIALSQGTLTAQGYGTLPANEAHIRHVRHHASHWAFLCFKRVFDVVVSLLLLSFLFPVMVLVAIATRFSSPGPAIYCQKRLTEGGRIFTMFKFRTMVANAEQGSGAVWAEADDPRVTKLGRFLRRTRIDELPQLFNVLVGDMSLIGPRPERPEFAVELQAELPAFYRRLRVKAGLTGLAQIAAGYAASTESYRTKLAWDILYIRRRSILLELLIAVKNGLRDAHRLRRTVKQLITTYARHSSCAVLR